MLFEKQSAAHQITRYSTVDGRPFLYTMMVFTCSSEKVGGVVHGGCSGDDVFVAYYDLNGDGVFETMETPRDPKWLPTMPKWAR